MAELADRIDSREFSAWMAYYSIEPFGEEPANIRHGILTSTLANVNRDPKRRPQAYRPEEFMIPHPGPLPTGEGARGSDEPRWMETKARMKALVKPSPRRDDQ